MIESVNNELIKKYAKLKEKKYRDLENLFIVEGKHNYEEAKKKTEIIDVFTLDGSVGKQVSLNVMKKLSSLTNPSNIVAICKKIKEREFTGNILILDRVQDPGNLGTIIRSSVAFNIDTIVLSNDTVDQYNPKVIKASEGMLFNINIIRTDIKEFIKELKDYKVLVTSVKNGTDIKKYKNNNKIALVMGSEGQGVKEEINALADDFIYIKMNEECESLNVSVATSIILYELFNNS